MSKRLMAAVSVLLALTSAGAVAVSPQRTFVASNGLDTSPTCSLAAPCRSFNTAISVVTPGGEVVALDSAGYGTLTINKSVQVIVPPGVHAAIFASTGTAVDVSAGPTDTVVLRGLYINSNGGAGYGILFNAGAALEIENVVVNGFANDGLYVGTGGIVAIRDSIFRNNLSNGISTGITSGTLKMTVERTRLTQNGSGFVAYGGNAQIAVRDTVADGNAGSGFFLQISGAGNIGTMLLDHCTSHANVAGVGMFSTTGGTATVRVMGSTITQNSSWGVLGGAGIVSFGNNTLEENFSNNTFSATYTPK